MPRLLVKHSRHVLPVLILLGILPLSLGNVLSNLYVEAVNSTGIYPYVAISANFIRGGLTVSTWGLIGGDLARFVVFILKSFASLLAIAASTSLIICKSDRTYKRVTLSLTLVTLVVAFYPYLAILTGLPAFVLYNDGTNPGTMQLVALLPSQYLYVGGSASPYNLRFAGITYATSTSSAMAFVNPIGLDLDLKDLLATVALAQMFVALKQSDVRQALQETLSRYPTILAKGWAQLASWTNSEGIQ